MTHSHILRVSDLIEHLQRLPRDLPVAAPLDVTIPEPWKTSDVAFLTDVTTVEVDGVAAAYLVPGRWATNKPLSLSMADFISRRLE